MSGGTYKTIASVHKSAWCQTPEHLNLDNAVLDLYSNTFSSAGSSAQSVMDRDISAVVCPPIEGTRF
jgi:hypothetical protein